MAGRTENILKFESNYKSFEWMHIHSKEQRDFFNKHPFKKDISILFIPTGGHLRIDFNDFITSKPTLFFCGYQRIQILKGENITALNYNRDFYCIQIHDAEVACDGLLFQNAGQSQATELSPEEYLIIQNLFILRNRKRIVPEGFFHGGNGSDTFKTDYHSGNTTLERTTTSR